MHGRKPAGVDGMMRMGKGVGMEAGEGSKVEE